MNIKKFIAGAVASAVAVSAMAVAASAATVNVDASKLLWGDPEDKGNLRIELYNEYGTTKDNSPINTADIAGATQISVTFTLSGAPSGDYTAVLGYAEADWGDDQDWESSVAVTGDGTYTLTSKTFDSADGAIVFVIDIAEMGADAGISQDEDYDMSVITVSNVSITTTTAGDAANGSTDGAGADPNKGSPDTGVEGVAVVAGLAIIAAGAVVVAKKRG